MTPDQPLEQAAALLADAQHAVALTGAGISAESGIRTFRGAGGLWTEHGEPSLNQFDGFRRDPAAWWRDRIERERQPEELMTQLLAAEPNDGHRALVTLETLGVLAHVITQNVDDLHRRAGHQSLTEIHGNVHWMRCMDCHSRWPQAEVIVDPAHLPPRCSQPRCDGVVKSDGVMFGEPIPATSLARCEQETLAADLFIAIGTTAEVYPAAHYPRLAAQMGLPLIEVNTEPTALTPAATLVLSGAAGSVLPPLVERVRELRTDG